MNRPVKPRPYNSQLRADQAAATRRRILDAAVDTLASTGGEITIGSVASTARVSDRTVYNHFESLEGLLDAVGEHLADEVLTDPPFDSPDSLVESVREAWRLSEERERVLRASSAFAEQTRPARYASIRKVVRPLVAHLDERQARAATAALFAVRGAAMYLTLRDDHAATSDEAAEAMAWLLQLGIDDLRAGGGPTPPPGDE